MKFFALPLILLLTTSISLQPSHAVPLTSATSILHGWNLEAIAVENEASPPRHDGDEDIPSSLRAQYEAAYFAWDRGEYVEALERAEQILNEPDGELLLGRIAQLTGELYHVEEIAPDGRAVQWSAGGEYVSYETGSDDEMRTHVVDMRAEDRSVVASVEGQSAVFSPTRAELAYMHVPVTPEMETMREAEQEALAERDIPRVRQIRQEIARLQTEAARILVLDLVTGEERERTPDGFAIISVTYAGDGTLLFIGQTEGMYDRIDLFALPEDAEPRRLTDEHGISTTTVLSAGMDRIIYSAGNDRLVVHELQTDERRVLSGSSPAVSMDGSTLAYVSMVEELGDDVRRGEAIVGADVRGTGHLRAVKVVDLENAGEPAEVRRSTLPIANPALSPSGERVAYMMMPRDDWEIYIASTDDGEETRLTREIQHDFFPQFLSEDRLMALMGEARHRRSYVYEVDRDSVAVHAERLLPGRDERGRVQMFHNNTLRTIAPQYEWEPSPDGTRVLVVADRDGNTVSPERGVYVVHLHQKVTRDEVLDRIAANLEHERDLRERGRAMFEPIEDDVRAATEEVSVGRIYDYAHALYQMGAKWFEDPGKLEAIEYLADKLRDMGYEPELQWFEPREEVRTANVIATLPGTANPEKIYVISSHFDSVRRSPGADDNSSGTTALLEAARVLAERPQAATIQFAFLGAEEAGLLGAREYVRRALEDDVQLAGVINNDMLGWTRSHRLDNTIRYSNTGIRDVQHAAAIQFSDLITYDARYVRGTDAAAFYDGYGDIIGGIGAYPVLGNPHYHQPHDILETINHRLVAEVSRATVGAIMRLASSPRPLADLEIRETEPGTFEARWASSNEQNVSQVVVAYGPPEEPKRVTKTVEGTHATLTEVEPGWHVAVQAVSDNGLTSWDWTRTTVPGSP